MQLSFQTPMNNNLISIKMLTYGKVYIFKGFMVYQVKTTSPITITGRNTKQKIETLPYPAKESAYGVGFTAHGSNWEDQRNISLFVNQGSTDLYVNNPYNANTPLYSSLDTNGFIFVPIDN